MLDIEMQRVIARLQEIAEDGKMPTQTEWNRRRGDLPASNTITQHRLVSWDKLAKNAGLEITKARSPRSYDLGAAITSAIRAHPGINVKELQRRLNLGSLDSYLLRLEQRGILLWEDSDGGLHIFKETA